MAKPKNKSFYNDIKPKLIKGITNVAQGYLFGCMVGLFTGRDKVNMKNIHDSGMKMAKVSAIYSTTEIVLETVRQKEDIYNDITAGVIAGGIGSKGKLLSGSTLFGAVSLGIYSGLSSKLSKEDL